MCARSSGSACSSTLKGKLSGEDSDQSPPQIKKRKDTSREPSAAESARDEMECLLAETAPKKVNKPQKKKAPQAAKITSGIAGTGRQKELEEK